MDLPMGNEPLKLADGTEIDCSSGKVIKPDKPAFVPVPSPSEAQRIVTRARKSVADLPLPPNKMSGVALVAFYTLFGLSDRDIAIALNAQLTEQQIDNIRELDAYKEFMTEAKANMLYTEQNTVREMFENHASNAASKIIELAKSDNDVLAFTASKDVLDRAGHRPADVVEHRHKMEDSLHIVVTKRDESKEPPIIDVTPTRIDADA